MPWEWCRFVHEDWNEGRRDLPTIQRAFGVVTDAVATLGEGRTVDPAWPAGIAELATVYRQEVDQLRREVDREQADRLKARGT